MQQRNIIIGIVIVLIVLLGAYFLWTDGTETPAPPAETPPATTPQTPPPATEPEPDTPEPGQPAPN